MLANVRKGDLVRVTCEHSPHYEWIGIIDLIGDTESMIISKGVKITLPNEHLTIYSRVGSTKHASMSEAIMLSYDTSNIDELGYDMLINIAIDLEEWEWATELVNRRAKYVAKEKRK